MIPALIAVITIVVSLAFYAVTRAAMTASRIRAEFEEGGEDLSEQAAALNRHTCRQTADGDALARLTIVNRPS